MAEVIGVRFKEVGKVYYFDPNGIQMKKGDMAIVETARGVECGRRNSRSTGGNEDGGRTGGGKSYDCP